MIDTDKYEGHTLHTTTLHMDEADSNGSREMRLSDGGIVGWLIMDNYPKADINAKLIAAAPDLLAEVKRLCEGLRKMLNPYNNQLNEYVDKEPLPKWLAIQIKELIE